MTEDEIRDLFREMREAPVPADSLVRVRSRVEGRMRRRGQWKIAAWALAAVAVFSAALVFRPAPAMRKPIREVVVAHRTVTPAMPVEETVRPTVRHAVHRARRVIPSSIPAAPVLIEIQTPDPEVVIRLIGE